MPREPHRLITELKARRMAAGFSAREAARRAGLGEAAVSDWESARCHPTVAGLELYMAVFGLELLTSDVSARHEEAMRRLALEAIPVRPTAEEDEGWEPVNPDQAAEHRAELAEALGFSDDLPAHAGSPAGIEREAA